MMAQMLSSIFIFLPAPKKENLRIDLVKLCSTWPVIFISPRCFPSRADVLLFLCIFFSSSFSPPLYSDRFQANIYVIRVRFVSWLLSLSLVLLWWEPNSWKKKKKPFRTHSSYSSRLFLLYLLFEFSLLSPAICCRCCHKVYNERNSHRTMSTATGQRHRHKWRDTWNYWLWQRCAF